MKDTCKQTSQTRTAPRVELIYTRGDQPKSRIRIFQHAFLNGDLEHEIYMKIPEGYDEVINPRVDKEDCLNLQKAIYGLVQAARQFWKKIVDKTQERGFKFSESDPCMLYKEDEKGV